MAGAARHPPTSGSLGLCRAPGGALGEQNERAKVTWMAGAEPPPDFWFPWSRRVVAPPRAVWGSLGYTQSETLGTVPMNGNGLAEWPADALTVRSADCVEL